MEAIGTKKLCTVIEIDFSVLRLTLYIWCRLARGSRLLGAWQYGSIHIETSSCTHECNRQLSVRSKPDSVEGKRLRNPRSRRYQALALAKGINGSQGQRKPPPIYSGSKVAPANSNGGKLSERGKVGTQESRGKFSEGFCRIRGESSVSAWISNCVDSEGKGSPLLTNEHGQIGNERFIEKRSQLQHRANIGTATKPGGRRVKRSLLPIDRTKSREGILFPVFICV